MNIQDLLGIGNRRNKFTNPRSSTASINFTISSQQSAAERPSIEPGMRRSEIDRVLNENLKFQLKEAHNRIQEQRRQERQRPPRRVTGSLRVSNTDSIRRARQVRSRLIAKLQEVAGSDMHERARGATAMDIKLQI
ncbi:MAG: hypothetical protein FWF81_09145, partial [Defluviitaleaceae bacterium]|nr:hypothetical protein [Defluviitaleaceae bacterium]